MVSNEEMEQEQAIKRIRVLPKWHSYLCDIGSLSAFAAGDEGACGIGRLSLLKKAHVITNDLAVGELENVFVNVYKE